MRFRLKKTLLVTSGVLGLVLLGGVLYLSFGDLSGLCRLAEGAAGEALGRELRISGRCVPELWSPARLLIEDATLAGPDWSADPLMVSLDRLAVELDLWSLLTGPIRVRSLEIEGARVLLEKDEAGRTSWTFDIGRGDEPKPEPKQEPGDKGAPLIAEHLEITNLEIIYRDALADRRHVVRVDRLGLDLEADGMMRIESEAALDDLEVWLSGELGRQTDLFQAGPLSAQLEARVAEADLRLTGSVGELASLSDPRLEVTVQGEEIATVTETLGTPSLGSGPFHLAGRLTGESLDAEAQVTLEAGLGDVEASVEGTVASVINPRELDLKIEAAGADLDAVASLAGMTTLPAQPFELSGALQWDGSGARFDGVRVEVGDNTFAADGEMSLADATREMALTVSLEGPDLSVWGPLADLSLPAVPFRGGGRLSSGDGEADTLLEAVELTVGSTSLDVDGVVGSRPAFEGTSVDLQLASEDPSWLSPLVGVELPSEPIRISGSLGYLGEKLRAEGLTMRVGEHEAEAEGMIGLSRSLEGTDLQLRIGGPSLAGLLELVPLETPDVPAVPYRLAGRLVASGDDYLLETVEILSGEMKLRLDGTVGAPPELTGTSLDVAFEGPRLSDLGSYAELPPLPSEAFALSGRVGISNGVYEISGATASLGAERLEASGAVGPLPGLLSTDVCLKLAGPDLSVVGEHLVRAEVVPETDWPDLIGDRYSVSGCVRLLESGYVVSGLEVGLGDISAQVDGTIGSSPRLAGTEAMLRVSGPSAAAFSSMTGIELPPEAFEIAGRVRRTESATELESVRVRLGDLDLGVEGSLGDPPELAGSDLRLRLDGPGPRLLNELLELELPEAPLEVVGSVSGSRSRMSLDGLRVELGGSDLQGTARVDLGETPDVQVDLRSEMLNLHRLLPSLEGAPGGTPIGSPEIQEAEVPQGEPGVEAVKETGLVFADDALEFEVLRSVDATIRYEADRLRLAAGDILDVVLAADLRDGSLRLLPTTIHGPHGSELSAVLTLVPTEEGYTLDARIAADRLELLGAFTEGVETVPTIDFDLDLKGTGATPHELMSNADGVLLVTVNPGFLAGKMLNFLGGDLLFETLGAVNPFAEGETGTEVECAVALGQLQDGVMEIDPVILRTTRMDVVGVGRVDFETEAVDFSWTIKNRTGVGLSIGMFTDSSIKLGGTLASPRLEVTPLAFAVERTKTVATAGAWPALQSLWNRVTAGKDRCGKALKESRLARRDFRREQRRAEEEVAQ